MLLVCVALPLKYAGDSDTLARVVGIAHGWLFVVLLGTVADLWRRRRFPLKAAVLVAASGLVPFLTFYAERQITARVHDGRY